MVYLYCRPIRTSTTTSTSFFFSMDHVSSSSPYSSFRSFCSLATFESPINPVTPIKFSGIPFKWEEHPGVPKPYALKPKHKEPSRPLLPPPPRPRYVTISGKKDDDEKEVIDPFMAALAACSAPPEEQWRSSGKVTRTSSDRFGFIALYGSCKNVASVVEPTARIHRSRRSSPSISIRRLS